MMIQSEKSVHTMVFQMNIITETYVGKQILKMNKIYILVIVKQYVGFAKNELD